LPDALDKERKEKGARGPLHGIPVLIKDNIDTADKMMTTAGSLAMLGSIAPKDSFVVERLRAAGAVILGKTNLSEWANFRSAHSTSGWSGRGGQTRNPYALDRNPCGSSSGSGAAISANFAAIAVGHGDRWFGGLSVVDLRPGGDQTDTGAAQPRGDYSDRA
jgi:amidase